MNAALTKLGASNVRGVSGQPHDHPSAGKPPYDGRATVLFEHWCEHPGCDAWGSFGEGVSLLRGIKGRWWCHGHWKIRQQIIANEKDEAKKRIKQAGKQRRKATAKPAVGQTTLPVPMASTSNRKKTARRQPPVDIQQGNLF